MAPERAAEFQLRDRPKAQTLSGIVSLTRGAVTRMVVERPANGGQAALCDEEYVIVRAWEEGWGVEADGCCRCP